jgi:hypothetical protein
VRGRANVGGRCDASIAIQQAHGPPIAFMQAYGPEAAQAGVDVADASLAAIGEEKDPRCLLLSFQIVQASRGLR